MIESSKNTAWCIDLLTGLFSKILKWFKDALAT